LKGSYTAIGPYISCESETLDQNMADAQNPLLSPQREKAGSDTKAKYAYQYHWALYRAIQEHRKANEYAVFVELHEDVVLCDSLDASKAKFEFNQVKTNSAKFTKTALIRPKNGSSPLGKLISSVSNKAYADKILVFYRGRP